MNKDIYKLIQTKFNFQIISKKVDEIEINVTKVNERIIFFYCIKGENDIDLYIERLTYLFQKLGYKKIISEIVNDESHENRFLAESEFTLPEFLWDLYIVFINNTSIEISKSKKNKIERDDFFARKILIEETDNDKLILLLKEILYPQDSISNLVKSFELNESQLISYLFKDNDGQVCDFMVKDFISYINKTHQFDENIEKDIEEEFNLNNMKSYLLNINQEIKILKDHYKEIKEI